MRGISFIISRRKEDKKMGDKLSLNTGQFNAATYLNGPELILAGAGTGKTHTLTMRIGYLIQAGIPADQILLLTFTNAAAHEMAERAEATFGPAVQGITACTYHSFANMMLRTYGAYIGLKPDFTIITQSDARTMISEIISNMPVKGLPRVNKIHALFSASVNRDIPIQTLIDKDKDFEKCRGWGDELTAIYLKFTENKKRANVLDFDDLLVYFEDMLHNAQIKNLISEKYRYIMVDEFQDTNNIQARIVDMMSERYNNIAVVGDDYQSIYAFRGSNIEQFVDFPDRHQNTNIVQLNENYRSTQEILDFANEVMGHFLSKSNPYNFKTRHKPDLVSGIGRHGKKPVLYDVADPYKELDILLSAIRKKQEEKKLSDLCIIYRNTASVAHLEAKLVEKKIPYAKRGGQKFFDRDDVQDIMGYMRVLLNPLDQIAWYRILKVHPQIGNMRSSQVSRECTHSVQYIYDFLVNTAFSRGTSPTDKKVNAELTMLFSFLTDLAQSKGSPSDVIGRITDFYIGRRKAHLEETDAKVKAGRAKQDTADKEADAIDAIKGTSEILSSIAAQYNNINDFMDNLSLDNAPEAEDESAGKLTLTTVHSAKGLEWNDVYIMDVTDSTFPAMNRIGYDTKDPQAVFAVQEELRCFYVAITRARDELALIKPRAVSVFGHLEEADESMFTREMSSIRREYK